MANVLNWLLPLSYFTLPRPTIGQSCFRLMQLGSYSLSDYLSLIQIPIYTENKFQFSLDYLQGLIPSLQSYHLHLCSTVSTWNCCLVRCMSHHRTLPESRVLWSHRGTWNSSLVTYIAFVVDTKKKKTRRNSYCFSYLEQDYTVT